MDRTHIPDLQCRPQEKGYKTTISLKEYLDILNNEGGFIIPDYQRGYVWGQKKKNIPEDSVTYLIKTLKDGFLNENKDIFLQGITVHKKKDSYDIVLVDGQQRTTFFYLLLKYLEYDGYLSIKYDIREESNEYLRNKTFDYMRDDEEEFQDIFFFKRTMRYFDRDLSEIENKKLFRDYILKHVKFLFVIIPEDQAKIVFTMMNGNKAKMTEEELIKAELLRCASLEHELIEEVEHSALRARLAREWDHWLYWWNQPSIQIYFRTGGRQLGWLLPLICGNSNVSFREFQDKLLPDQSMKQSKRIFKKMRLLQKSIEDLYNNSISYNYVGVILYICKGSEQIFAFLGWYFDIGLNKELTHTKSEEELKRYYNWSIIGVNHKDIVAHRIEKYNEARNRFLEELKSNTLFLHHYETAYRWLIRQNIRQDNLHNGRKFNFEIERDRSIEHVYSKSKVGHRNEEGKALNWKDEPIDDKNIENIMLWREDMRWFCKEEEREYNGSEHCIGNLLLLYKRDNSKFNNADFRKKNEYFFTDQDDESFKSRHLIHTTMVFSDVNWEDTVSGTLWNKEQVPKRKQAEIKEFENEYPEL